MEKQKIRICYNKEYTSEELEGKKVIVLDTYENVEIPSIREEDGVIYYGDEAHEPEIYYAYVQEKETESFHNILDWGKYFLIPPHAIGRSNETEMKWVYPSHSRQLMIKQAGDIVDLIYFIKEDTEIEWVRIIGTNDPYQEVPKTSSLYYKYEEDGITITGMNRFTERIHIPAKINGILVKSIILQPHLQSKFLREIVIEEGVEELQMFFGNPYLETIDIPESVQLQFSPKEIYKSLWFEQQPDGPVYFKNWFCGIKGTYLEDTLTLKEGTIGIIEDVPLSKNVKRIVFPKSLREIGMQTFCGLEHLEEILLPEGSEGQRIQMEGTFKMTFDFIGERSIKGEQVRECLCWKIPE